MKNEAIESTSQFTNAADETEISGTAKSLSSRKKKRNPKLRRSARAEAYVPVLLDALSSIGAFDPTGQLIQPVVEDYFLRNCTNYRRYRNPVTGKMEEVGGDLTGRLLGEALLGIPGTNCTPGEIAPQRRCTWMKRWGDTTPELQAIAIQYALKIQNKPHRQLTFHIVKALVDEAIQSDLPLQAFILRRLRTETRRLLGDADFGLWFHIEQVPFEADSLHAHGLIYIDDENWLTDNLRQNERLRDLIRRVTGDDGRVGNNWLAMRKLDMDAGNIWYSTKASNNRMRSRHRAAPPIEQTGIRLEGRTHSMSRIGKEFYTRIRPFLNAAMTNELLDWDDPDWDRVGAVRDQPFTTP